MKVAGWKVEVIRGDSFVEAEAGSGESEAVLHPMKKEERRKM